MQTKFVSCTKNKYKMGGTGLEILMGLWELGNLATVWKIGNKFDRLVSF